MEQNEIMLNEFIESVEKIKAKYFVKGQMTLKDNNDLSIVKKYQTEISKIYVSHQYKIGVKWYFLKLENENLDFWESDKFERFLNNEVDILKYVYMNYGLEQVEAHKLKLNRLREIYNKRFLIEIEQENTPNILTSAPQRVLLMYELGIFDLLNNIPEIKDNPTKIAKLVSEFTGENIDTIRKPYLALTSDRDTSGYNFKSVKNVTALNNVYKKIGIERKKR
jgi:hypothetical protein